MDAAFRDADHAGQFPGRGRLRHDHYQWLWQSRYPLLDAGTRLGHLRVRGLRVQSGSRLYRRLQGSLHPSVPGKRRERRFRTQSAPSDHQHLERRMAHQER